MKAARAPASLKGVLQCTKSGGFAVNGPLRATRLPKTHAKAFTTSTQLRAETEELDANWNPLAEEEPPRRREKKDEKEKKFYARVVPVSPAYFTRRPTFTTDVFYLQQLVRKYALLPTARPGEAPRIAWRNAKDYLDFTGEAVPDSRYRQITSALQRLNQIHPSIMPNIVKRSIKEWTRDINPALNVAKLPKLDRFGRTMAVGRRKSSVASAYVVEGTGEVLVNGKTLAEAFARVHDRESVIWALKITNRMEKYNVWGLVNGGGTTGQAEALALAVGKALIGQEPDLKPAVRRAGCVTRDPRRVERKKPGKVKARKMPAWVKR